MMLQFLGSPVKNPLQTINPSAHYDELKYGGLISFISNVVKFIIVAGGVWAFINLLIAGFTFITAGGNPDGIQTAWRRIYMSLIGLLIMVSSYLIAILLGYLLFGDGSAILSPQIFGP